MVLEMPGDWAANRGQRRRTDYEYEYEYEHDYEHDYEYEYE